MLGNVKLLYDDRSDIQAVLRLSVFRGGASLLLTTSQGILVESATPSIMSFIFLHRSIMSSNASVATTK